MDRNKAPLNIANNQNFTQNNQQNTHYHYEQLQQQQQPNLEEEQAIIQYYVYEDFQNFLNLLYSFQAVKEFFKKNPEHILIKISENKLLTQMNLSNSIHYDLQMTSKHPKQIECLQKNKKALKSQIREVCPQEFEKEIKFYEEYCLNEKVSIKRLELKATQLKANFNEGVLQQILPQIQTVENKVNYIRKNKKYQIPSIQDMKKIAEQYKDQTNQKLKEQKIKL
ncbi:unnamed protein product (macronuclear) [Paramecium tetraurelia]|uniref:Uncharacterized protein n=1 Tax=Paramecium tetraurelia TaxID=5888 RepID=A0CSZ5_PARTE|nr:uncharacterized protein GSPATT00038930001 [Paramecium tetraurelia]CAK73912.1 unnamed protein product [Paramecium tetraurelia]|eukprot:XP_001441309.1 hypothetical protein (macronuclear) [Paramecium tetraurelia strain d4-2]